jgi:hypothetical protein
MSTEQKNNPQFPVYVISKGRWESRLTSKALEEINVPYRIVIEPQEYIKYAEHISPNKILTLPFSNLGQGSIPARNWVWEHSIKEGHTHHWILDDNIAWLARIHKNKKTRVSNGLCFKITEDFTLRYTNVALSGLQYEMFVVATQKAKPVSFNTRIYSCILIRNDIPFRWRGKYNEDTDLSIRALKQGWCTILMQAFVCKKMTTMKMKGGNTDLLYKQNKGFDGRLEMAKSLQRQHPEITTIKWKWGRWQHEVDYSCFKKNKLIKKEGLQLDNRVNNYGLELLPK